MEVALDRRAEVVLVGGGHAHVQVLRAFAMDPLPGARITVIVDRPVALYSGMVPGFVAGEYAREDLEIDVRPLARRAGARVIVARVEGVDAADRRIRLVGRPSVAYDVASLNVGSIVAGGDVPGVREHTVSTRPLHALLEGLPARLAGGGSVAVVGAGMGGLELAFCLHARLRAEGRAVSVSVIDARWPFEDRPRLSRRILADLAERGIAFVHGAVERVLPDAVVLADGRSVPSSATVWVAGAAGPPFLADGLPVDARGFVRVRDTLQVEGHDDLFAVGDCAVLLSWPEIPKAGVHAVRQGPVLTRNLRAILLGRPLEPYRPQRDFFAILNRGDGTALGTKWGLFAAGAWMLRWKDRIDRAFMRRFQVLDRGGRPVKGLPMRDGMDVACGGCAAKVGEGPLGRALGRLAPVEAHPDVVMGLAEADDVAAVRHRGGLVVQSVDAFTAFVDDPFVVGRVAAVNAVNDLYAKGVDPRFAMAVVGIPDGDDAEETLFQVLCGARAALDPLGVALTGGHTSIGAALTVGFAVTGFGERVPWPIAGARPGDVLVLTRPLGTGVLFHEDMAGRAAGSWVEAALATMTRSCADAARVARGFPVRAATDVSGFGLAGHTGEMMRKSGASAVLEMAKVPLLPGVAVLLEQGARSTFHAQNREALSVMRVEGTASGAVEALFDPQTAGGLLLAVPVVVARSLLAALHDAGEADAVVIGEVVEPRDALLTVR